MSISIYIHFPFCESKCPYCDFNSHVAEQLFGDDKLMKAPMRNVWLSAYLKELEFYHKYLQGKSITSIFFGGGTPSLMPPTFVAAIIDKIIELSGFARDRDCFIKQTEISMEANPSSSEYGKFRDFRDAGINRLSLGVQSFNEDRLKFLGRKHDKSQAIAAIEHAQGIFENYNIDIIYSLPNEDVATLRQELSYIKEYNPPHISCYQLTIERGTKFYADYREGKFIMPNDDVSNTNFDMLHDSLAGFGYNNYEISNFAKTTNLQCQHNLTYWRYKPYLAIGAGGHARLFADNKMTAYYNIHNPEAWLKSVEQSGNGQQKSYKIDNDEIIRELLYMNLRLREGLDKKHFRDVAGVNFDDVFNESKLKSFMQEGLAVNGASKFRLTDNGLKMLNAIYLTLSI